MNEMSSTPAACARPPRLATHRLTSARLAQIIPTHLTRRR